MIECQKPQKWICSADAKDVLAMLILVQFGYGRDFLYFLGESKDEDGSAVSCLEVVEFGGSGRWLSETYFTGFGDDARFLRAFYDSFLTAGDGQHLKVAAMIHSGVTDPDDIRAGLRLNDFDRLRDAIGAAGRRGIGLRFFVHPKR